MIYLDHNATTPPSSAVRARVDEALASLWANPSSVHRAGQDARHALELARNDLASLLGVPPRSIVFTSSGTESIDLAIRGSLAASGRRAIVASRVEHAAVRDLCEDLERAGEAEIRWARVAPGGVVEPDAVAELLDDRVALVSVQWANNETGVVQPVGAIGALCRARGVRFHTDATQWVGKMPVVLARGEGWDEPWGPDAEPQRRGIGAGGGPRALDAPGVHADLLTCSAHKFHGPKGVGLLHVRAGVALHPTLRGSQELGRRGGTENVPGILGAGVAAREALDWLADPGARARLASMRDRFEARLLDALPWAVVNSRERDRLWNTSSVAFPSLEAEPILLMLSERGVYASAGAACSSGSLEPSPVLLAMGVPPQVAHASIRFSLARDTTWSELERAAAIVIECVNRLASMSRGVIA